MERSSFFFKQEQVGVNDHQQEVESMTDIEINEDNEISEDNNMNKPTI